jgi:acetyl-CoA carboxylase biotin carboxyl carrier protein
MEAHMSDSQGKAPKTDNSSHKTLAVELDDIERIVDRFEHSKLESLEFEFPGGKIKVSKASPTAQQVAPVVVNAGVSGSPATTTPAQAAPDEPAASAQSQAPATQQVDGTPVTSPLVGIFYSAPAPDEEPFVQVGDRVEKGQTLCIVEAMKVMNEITAPCAGTVEHIDVQDMDLVEYGQVLMVLGD